jgi:sugar-specific transcriptional regulator TrmB
MNNQYYISKLQDFDLTTTEAKIYLESLKFGPSTIMELARLTELKRTTVHTAIARMIDKGIFGIEHNGWKRLYVATDPDNLQFLAKKQYEKQLQTIPELKTISQAKSQNIYLKSHRGAENIKNLYTKLLIELEPDTEYLIIGNVEMWTKTLGDYAVEFFEERGKLCKNLNISVRALFVDNEFARKHNQSEQKRNVKIKFLPKQTVITTSYITTSKRAIFHQLTNYSSFFETNDPNFIHTQSELFNILWDYAL